METRVLLDSHSVIGDKVVPFTEPITLKVVLEVLGAPPKDPMDVTFMWRPIWDPPVDQELDNFEVGPLTTPGKHELILQSDAPDFAEIPDPTGPTALTVAFCYKGEQFLHIGYNAVVTCEGEIPEVFEDAKLLRRQLTQCFVKATDIAWDSTKMGEHDAKAAADHGEKEVAQDPVSPLKKKIKHEEEKCDEGEEKEG